MEQDDDVMEKFLEGEGLIDHKSLIRKGTLAMDFVAVMVQRLRTKAFITC